MQIYSIRNLVYTSLWKSEYICKKNQEHKIRVFLLIHLQIPVIVKLVRSAALPCTELPTVPHVLNCGHCRTKHKRNCIQPFRAELCNWSHVCPLLRFVFHFLPSGTVQKGYNTGAQPLVSVCFVRKTVKSINQNQCLSHWLYFDSLFLFFFSLELLNTIIFLAAIPEEFCYSLYKIKDVIILW